MSFPQLLKSLRESKGIPQEILGAGLSSVNSYVSRIENGEVQPDKMTRDLLMGRLGYAMDGFEEYLHPEEYEIYRMRHALLRASQLQDDTALETRLGCFDRLLSEDMIIARQFSMFMHLHLNRVKGVDENALHQMTAKAVLLTIPSTEPDRIFALPLSVQELNLILELIQTTKASHYEKGKLLERMIHYINESGWESQLKAKLFPKAVYYYLRSVLENPSPRSDLLSAFHLCEEAVEILRNSKRSYYVLELCDVREILLSRPENIGITPDEATQKREQTKAWKSAISAIFLKCGLSGKMINDAYLYDEMEFYLIGDVIRKRRKMIGMTQESLAETAGVGKSTVYRAEKNVLRLQADTMKNILRTLGLSGEPAVRDVVTSDVGMFDLIRDYKKAFAEHHLDIAKTMAEQIRSSIRTDEKCNLQFAGRCLCNVELEQKSITVEEYIHRMRELIELTIPYSSVMETPDLFLSKGELLCLQNMAVECAKTDEGIQQYFRMFEEYFRRIVEADLTGIYINTFELVMTFVASAYGNRGRFEESNALSMLIIKESLPRRRLVHAYRGLHNLCWNAQQQHTISEKEERRELEFCIALSDFCKRESHVRFFTDKMISLKKKQEKCS